ncbi:MAG TPA: hypothetical protein VKT78_07500 [Fimbriimonadaceae bacterium]|nr:hypothetical protein [Fimbriimonadaceae bacterium]
MLYPKDKSVTVARSADRLIITYRWRMQGAWALLVLGLFMGLVAPLLLLLLVPQPAYEGRSGGQAAGLFMFEFIAIPVVYGGLAFVLNRTIVVADREQIRATSGPIPAALSRHFDTKGVTQFFVRRPGSSQGQSSIGSVYMLDAEHVAHHLLVNLPSTFAASQVVHELQDFYGLEDLEIYGVTTDPEHPGPRPN